MDDLLYEYIKFDNSYLPFAYEVQDFEQNKFVPNRHNDFELIFIESGAGSVKISGKEAEFKKNDVVVIPSNSIHYIFSNKAILHCIQINNDYMLDNGIKQSQITFPLIINSQQTSNIIYKLHNILNPFANSSNAPSTKDIIKIRLTVLELLYEIISSCSHDKNVNSSADISQKYISKALEYISDNLCDKFTISDISEKTGISNHHLIRLFKKHTNHTILEHRNLMRCQKANNLLEKGYPVSYVSAECGFDSMTHFSRIYKRYIGCLPSKYTSKSNNN